MLKEILNSATFRQSQITVVGTFINGFLGALFYILLARFLGPSNFGLMIISVTTLTLIADIVDFGTNTGLIRYVPKNLIEDESKALKFLKLSLEFKLLIWIVVFIVGFFISPIIATTIFNKPELINPLRLVMIGVGSALLFSFATSSLQAFQKYFLWSLLNIFTNLLRLILILILGYYLLLNVESSLLIYITIPFFGFFIALFILPTREFLTSKKEFSLSKEFFKYNIPVAVFTIIAAFSSRLDIYLTASLLSTREVGIYGAANQLVQVMPQIVSAIGLVAAPKFASFTSNKDMLIYLKKFQLFVLGLSVLGLVAIPISIYLIPFFFGEAYFEAISSFIILLLAMLVFLISVPVHHSIIFYFGRPDVFIWISLGHLFLIGTLGYFMILNYGVVGGAMTVLVGMLFNFIAPLIWFLLRIKR